MPIGLRRIVLPVIDPLGARVMIPLRPPLTVLPLTVGPVPSSNTTSLASAEFEETLLFLIVTVRSGADVSPTAKMPTPEKSCTLEFSTVTDGLELPPWIHIPMPSTPSDPSLLACADVVT